MSGSRRQERCDFSVDPLREWAWGVVAGSRAVDVRKCSLTAVMRFRAASAEIELIAAADLKDAISVNTPIGE